MAAAIGAALTLGLRRRGAALGAALASTLVVLAATEFRLVARPHLATTLGLVVLLDALTAARAGRVRHPVRLVVLFGLWANAHPGVVFGVLLAAGFVAAEAGWLALDRLGWRRRLGWPPRAPLPGPDLVRLATWTGLGVAATCLNPLGPGLYPYLLAHRDMQSELMVAELRPLLHDPRGRLAVFPADALLVGLYGALVLLGVRLRRRLDPTLAAAAVCFGVLGASLAREAPLGLIVGAFALAPALRLRSPPERARRLLGLALALALVPPAATLARRALGEGLGGGLRPGAYPVAAADWLLEHRPAGRIYNSNRLGGYLVWRLAPSGRQVYTDGRMPMFGRALRLARDFAAVEARWAPQILVIGWGPSPTEVPVPELTPGFHERYALVHASPGAKVYLRRGARNAGLVARRGYRELRYVGRLWPGRRIAVGDRVFGLPGPDDPAAFRAEVARARREAPDLEHLPGP